MSSKKNKLVVLVESQLSGHRSIFLREYAFQLNRLGYSVLIICPRNYELDEFLQNNSGIYHLEYAEIVRQVDFIILKSTINQFLFYRCISRASEKYAQQKELELEMIYVMYLDDFIKPMIQPLGYLTAAITKNYFSGLLFHTNSLVKTNSILKASSYDLLNSFGRLTTLNEKIVESLESLINKKVYLFPDFATVTLPEDWQELEIVKNIKQKAGDRKIITLIGTASSRKNYLQFLKLAQENPQYFFVHLGRLSKDFPQHELDQVEEIIRQQPENLWLENRFVTDEELDSVLHTSNLIFAVYSNFDSSSNMLAKAALHQILSYLVTRALWPKG
jgi:hypothetical protein